MFCQFFANFCQFTLKFAPKNANFCQSARGARDKYEVCGHGIIILSIYLRKTLVFKNAGREKRWDYPSVQNSQISLHIGCVQRYKFTNALTFQTMQKVIEQQLFNWLHEFSMIKLPSHSLEIWQLIQEKYSSTPKSIRTKDPNNRSDTETSV